MKDKRKLASKTMAESADRHTLYEKSVQGVKEEFNFVNDTFKALRKRQPHSVREDFCGTAKMCCEWVSRDKKNTATGVDIDPDVLATVLPPETFEFRGFTVVRAVEVTDSEITSARANPCRINRIRGSGARPQI